jgi:hypothetical protein
VSKKQSGRRGFIPKLDDRAENCELLWKLQARLGAVEAAVEEIRQINQKDYWSASDVAIRKEIMTRYKMILKGAACDE